MAGAVFPGIVRKNPQVPNTDRQAASLPGDISRGKPQPPDGECFSGQRLGLESPTPGAFLLTEGWPPLPGCVSEGLWSPSQAQLNPLLWEIPGFSETVSKP